MSDRDPIGTQNVDDPNAAIERRWAAAIQEWLLGQPEDVCTMISELSSPIPLFAREFLADLAAGKVKRRRGAPPKRTPTFERDLVMQVFEAWDWIEINDKDLRGDTPLEAAFAAVAECHEMTDTELRGVYEKLRRAGITRELWSKYLRPRPKPS